MLIDNTTSAICADFANWRGIRADTPGVLYACCPRDHKCEALVSGYDLYISKSCAAIRCPFCVVEEIVTHYCPHDLDNYPSHEAMKNTNRSSKAAECPECSNHLTAVSDSEAGESMHYFVCHWCHWHSQSIGLTAGSLDGLIKELHKQEEETPQDEEMERLIQHFTQAAAAAAQAAADEQKQKRGLGFMGSLGEQPKGLKGEGAVKDATQEWENKQHQLGYSGPRQPGSPIKGTEFPPGAPSDPKLRPSSLAQRHRIPDTQPREVDGMAPRRSLLMTKRSKRCPVSQNLLVKPELNPTKVSFHMRQDALSYIPRISVVKAMNRDTLLVRFTNPLDHTVRFRLEAWVRPGADGPTPKPFLLPVPDLTTTIGAHEELEFMAEKEVALGDDDDAAWVHSRSTNSVVIYLRSDAAIGAPLVQARLAVTVQIQEEELNEIKFHAIVNVPAEAWQ